MELNFQATAPLERVADELRRAGVQGVGVPTDEGFGRQLQVQLPGMPLVKVNELDSELYG